jgi:branched-chain amino acid transport system substrate-binding protein
MRKHFRVPVILSAALLGSVLAASPASAQKKYDPGASDTEIKIGNIMPYSGPASPYGVIGKTETVYFNKINAEGGINGRKITFISYDDGYSPPKTVEQARKLVESDEALLVFNPLGTPPNTAIQGYLNKKGVPQLFVATGATKWGDPEHFPWTMGWQPTYQAEARVYAKYVLKEKPDAKIAVFYQNDDYGKDYLKGLMDGLGPKAASMVVAQESYEVSEPTIDSHIVKLKSSGADVFMDFTGAKFAAQSIKKMGEIGWKPSMHFLNSVSTSIGAVIKPAGLDAAQGVISAAFVMDPGDPQWKDNPEMKQWVAFMDKENASADKNDSFNVYAYSVSRTLVQVLKQCGDNLTRENVMKQAASLKNFSPGLLLPGITLNTSATDYYPIEQLQLMRFQGESWQLFGPVLSGEING